RGPVPAQPRAPCPPAVPPRRGGRRPGRCRLRRASAARLRRRALHQGLGRVRGDQAAHTRPAAMTSDRLCELCEAARITPWHHEDDLCWVADCEICDVPMVVWKRHGADPPDDERSHMLARLTEVAAARFGAD